MFLFFNGFRKIEVCIAGLWCIEPLQGSSTRVRATTGSRMCWASTSGLSTWCQRFGIAMTDRWSTPTWSQQIFCDSSWQWQWQCFVLYVHCFVCFVFCILIVPLDLVEALRSGAISVVEARWFWRGIWSAFATSCRNVMLHAPGCPERIMPSRQIHGRIRDCMHIVLNGRRKIDDRAPRGWAAAARAAELKPVAPQWGASGGSVPCSAWRARGKKHPCVRPSNSFCQWIGETAGWKLGTPACFNC